MKPRVIASCLWIGFLIRLGIATAGEVPTGEAKAGSLVPESAKVSIECDRTEYFLGENVLLHFVLENAGDARRCNRSDHIPVDRMR